MSESIREKWILGEDRRRKRKMNRSREFFNSYKWFTNHVRYLSLIITASSTSLIVQILSETTSQVSIDLQRKDSQSPLKNTKTYTDAFIQFNDDTQMGNNVSDSLTTSNSQISVNNSDISKEVLLLNQQNSINGSNPTNVTSPPEESMKFPLYMRILATFACLLIFLVGVCGNLLVPIVVVKTKYLRNSTNLFLINLAVADLLVLIICEPTVLIELHSRPETWLLGEPMCKISNFVEMTAANASIFTILAISFERYYAICKPLKAGYKCTRLRATIIICLIWLLSFILTSPILIMAKSLETIYIDGSLVNNCILETDTYWHKMYVFVSMFAFFCLPLIVLMLVYWLISRRLIRENLALSTTTSLATNDSALHLGENVPNHQHQYQNHSCCCNTSSVNISKGNIRSQSLRKAASFKLSVSTFLASRYNATLNNNQNSHHHHQTNQMATQTDLIPVDVTAQSKHSSNLSHLRRAPKLTTEKALSLDHHSTLANVGCNNLLRENNRYHNNGRQACDSQNQVCCAINVQHKVGESSFNVRIPKQKQKEQHQQQPKMNIIELIKKSGSINSESFYKFIYRLLGFKPNTEYHLPASDELTHSSDCYHNLQEGKIHDDCNKSTSNGSELSICKEFAHRIKGGTTETSEFLMESICEELQAIDCNEVGGKKNGISDSFGQNNISCRSEQNSDQKVPFLSALNNNSSNTNRNSIGISSSNDSTKRKFKDIKTTVFEDQLPQTYRKKGVFGNTAKNLLNGAKETFRFNWPRQTSVSSSISISTSTQTNSTNLPSESSAGPISRRNSSNNPQQQQQRSILSYNNISCGTTNIIARNNNSCTGGCSSSLTSQIESNSFASDQISINGLNESCEQNQHYHMKRKNRDHLYQRKFPQIESSLSSSTVPDSNTALMVDCTDELRNNPDQITCNSTSSSATISSSSPYSSKSPSPDSLLERKKKPSPVRLELNNKQNFNKTDNSSSSSYKDLFEAENNAPSSSVEPQQQPINVVYDKGLVINESNLSKLDESIVTNNGENHLYMGDKTSISTGPLALDHSPEFEKPSDAAAAFQTLPNCDYDSSSRLLNGNDKQIYADTDKHEISTEKIGMAADNKNINTFIVKDKYKASESSGSILLTNRNRNNSVDINHQRSSITNVQDSISKCCSVHNQPIQNQHHLQNPHLHPHHHFHFSFTKRPHWSKRRSNPVICNHLEQNKSHLNELLVVQDLSKKQQMDSRRQVVIMLAFVVAAFFLLFFPYRVFTIWLILSTEDQVQSLGMETYYNLTYFSRILIYLHSAINPIAYNLISTKFRRAFMSILLCHGSSDRRYFTTEHRVVTKNNKLSNNSISDQKKSSIPTRASHQIRLPR